ncbi:MAG: hypothetical protein JKY92_00690 [Magnetovibrio sp.]|nr:hypothetical protein [Magnetovibrio sp.]
MADIINGLDKTFGGAKVWSREGRDVNGEDSFRTARLIGTVRLEHSRLNGFSAISKGEKEDNFTYKVASRGPLRLGKKIDSYTRVEFFNGTKHIIASNDPKSGRLYDKYFEMISAEGTQTDRGTYFIKFSRVDPNDTSKDLPYTFQLQMGSDFKHDYETIEYKAKDLKPGEIPASADLTAGGLPSSSTLMEQGLSRMIDDAMANFGKMLSGAASLLFGSRF